MAPRRTSRSVLEDRSRADRAVADGPDVSFAVAPDSGQVVVGQALAAGGLPGGAVVVVTEAIGTDDPDVVGGAAPDSGFRITRSRLDRWRSSRCRCIERCDRWLRRSTGWCRWCRRCHADRGARSRGAGSARCSWGSRRMPRLRCLRRHTSIRRWPTTSSILLRALHERHDSASMYELARETEEREA